MKKLLNLYKKDLILGFKDIWILLELGASVLIMALILFVIPKEIDREPTVFIHDQTEWLQPISGESSGQVFVDSRDELIANMKKNRVAVGMILTKKENGGVQIELLTQPSTTPAMVNYFRVQMTDLISMIHPPSGLYPPEVYQSVKVTSLKENVLDEIPFNKRLVPLILMFVVGFMGIFTMMSLISQERTDQTIRAYKITPSRLSTLIVSKHAMILTIGLITFSILFLPVIGFQGYLKGLLIIIPTILVGSAIGVFLGSYFDNPMSSMGWIFLLMILFGLPAVSLFAPVFSPEWLQFIPSFHIIFGLDAAMFPDSFSNTYWTSCLALVGMAMVLLPLSGLVFTNRLRREV